MVKIIGIFAIVFVYYCEINAEVDNLQYRKTPAADVRKILSSKKKFPGNKSGGIWLRSNAAQPHAKFTTGFREDIRGPHKEHVLRNGEARYNYLEHHVVKKRRFKRSYRNEENKQIDEHDNETKKPEKKKNHHHHHSRSKMNKNHNSTRNKKTKQYNNNIQKNDMEEKDDEEKDKKHHYHSRRKVNKNHNLTTNKKTKRYKNDTKRKDLEEKDKIKKHHYHSERKMNKYNDSTRYKKTKRYKNKNEDRHMNKDKKLNKEKNHTAKRNRDKNHIKYSEHPKKDKDHISKKKQAKDKSKDKQKEKNTDCHKHATTTIRISKMDMTTLVTCIENDHNKKLLLSKSDEKQREKSKHAKDKSKTAIGMAGLGAAGSAGAAGVIALVGKSLASMKDPKPQPERVLTSTTTSKPKPEPVQEQEVVREKKLIKRERLNLRTKEKTRVTRMIPYSLNKQEDEGNQNLRQREGGSGSSSAGSPPSNLSPYAITAQIELLMKEFRDVNATVSKCGRTVEYNDIVLVSITANKDETYFRVKESKYIDDVPEKKIIFIVHGLTVMGLKDMTSLVKSSELKLLLSYYFKHLDKFDVFLMPLANPDGYSASLSSDRAIWNKNVSPQSVCPGVFVDRNFDVAWNGTSKISSCSQLYPGASPFSEEESKAVRDVFHRYGHKILAYIHVHAGTFDEKVFKGDAILYPRGYTETQSDDDKYIDIKGEVDEAMKNASFRVMSATVDTLSNWYGVVAGTSVDYAATVYGIPYAMEFVMQLYDSESLNNNALTEIWSRIIDATFNKMWKSLQEGGDARRFI